MNCNVCGSDEIHGMVYRGKKLCRDCLLLGYNFADDGNIIDKNENIIKVKESNREKSNQSIHRREGLESQRK